MTFKMIAIAVCASMHIQGLYFYLQIEENTSMKKMKKVSGKMKDLSGKRRFNRALFFKDFFLR